MVVAPLFLSMRKWVGAADRAVISYSERALAKRWGSNLPEIVPVVIPSVNGPSVPCHNPWPQAAEEGQKNLSPGLIPVAYKAAIMR